MLTPVPYSEVWQRISASVEMLHGKSVEVVRQACESGEAVVLEAPDCYVIVSVVTQRDGDRELFVWALWGTGGRVVVSHHEYLREAAQYLGCKRIVGRISDERLGYLLAKHGWTRRHVEYALEIEG